MFDDMLPALRKKGWSLPSVMDDFGFGKLDRMFSSMMSDFDSMFGEVYRVEDGKVVYEIECPGFNESNLSVEVADGFVTIQGERKVEKEKFAGQKTLYKRISVGDVQEVEATIKDGILTLTLTYPKTESKKIQIKGKEEVV